MTAGACLPNGTANGQQCICSSSAECSSGTCGYGVDAAGLPVAPNICVANDGMPYQGCNSGTCAMTDYCCSALNAGAGSLGDVCVKACQSNLDCDSTTTCQPLTSGTCDGLGGSCVLPP